MAKCLQGHLGCIVVVFSVASAPRRRRANHAVQAASVICDKTAQTREASSTHKPLALFFARRHLAQACSERIPLRHTALAALVDCMHAPHQPQDSVIVPVGGAAQVLRLPEPPRGVPHSVMVAVS